VSFNSVAMVLLEISVRVFVADPSWLPFAIAGAQLSTLLSASCRHDCQLLLSASHELVQRIPEQRRVQVRTGSTVGTYSTCTVLQGNSLLYKYAKIG
jgi:hypothetical protein